jgi:hypothetical protein
MKIPNPWSTDPLVSLIGTEETAESIEGNPDASEMTAAGDTQMEYTSDYSCSPH